MSFTPGGINLLVAAIDREDMSQRISAMEDMRAAMHIADAKDFAKVIGPMRKLTRA